MDIRKSFNSTQKVLTLNCRIELPNIPLFSLVVNNTYKLKTQVKKSFIQVKHAQNTVQSKASTLQTLILHFD